MPKNADENSMQSFDPYHLWLGIPPREQPPNHYRLLGIEFFESDAEVIAMAADRQMMHLRTFQSGKHSLHSQRLLNEVAAAKVVLLSPAAKAAYDERLQACLQPQPIAAEEATPGPDDPSPWEEEAGELPPAQQRQTAYTPVCSSASARRAAGKRRTNLGAMIALAVAGASLLLGLAAWMATWRGGQTAGQAALAAKQTVQPTVRQPIDRPGPDARQATGRADKPPARTDSAAPIRPERRVVPNAESVAPSPPIPPGAPTVAKAGPAAAMTRPTFEKPAETVEKPAGPPEKPATPSFDFSGDNPADKPAGSPAAKKRLPVPDDAAQEKIAAQLARDYAPARAKTPAEKIGLAYQILQAAKASKEPKERYVLLGQGRELAAQAGDAALVLQVIEMTGEFDIDVLGQKGTAMLALAGRPNNAEQIGAFFEASQRVIAEALPAGRHELASDLSLAVYRTCQRSKEYRKKALDQRDRVQAYCRRQAERQEAEASLKANPADAEAHLALGRQCCLDDDWKGGLPHLAKGSDGEVRQLAQRDLASPAGPAEQIELADAWWTLGKARQGEDRELLLLRASHWYDRAHAKLTSGLERLKVEKRLEELAELRQRHAAGNRLLHPDKDSPRDLWNGVF